MVMAKFEEAKRVNHVQTLAKRNNLDKAEFIREAGYLCNLARPTLEKAWRGDTDLDYDTIEKLAWFFEVKTGEVLESKF